MSVLYKHDDEIERVAGAYKPYVINPRPDWSNAEVITANQLYAGYTAPSDGMIVGWSYPSEGHGFNLSINGINLCLSGSTSAFATVSTPINKNDIIKANDLPGLTDIHFVPWKEE